MTKKKVETRLKLNPKFNKTLDTNLNVWSHDENSYEFRFEFYDDECDMPIDLTNAKAKMLLIFKESDEKKHLLDLEIEDETLGFAKFTVPKRILGYEGTVNAHIYIDFEGKTHDFGNFLFRMKRSAIDEDFPELDTVYVSEFEKALEEIQEILRKFDGVEMDIDEKIKQIEQAIEQHELEVEQKLNDINISVDDRLTQINNNLDGTEEELNKRIDVIEKDIASNEVAKQSDVDSLQQELNANVSFLKKENVRQLTRINRLEKGVDYVSPPTDGYKKGDIWYFAEGTNFDGMNLLDDSESIYKSKGSNQIRRFFNINELKEHTISFDYELEESEASVGIFLVAIGSNVKRVTINDSKKGHITYNFTPSAIGRTMLDIVFGTGQAQSRENAGYLKNVIISSGEKEYPYSPSPTEVIKGNKLLISKKDNNDLNFNDWIAYDGNSHKPNIIDMQEEINELKNAITTLGGTL